MYGVFWTHAAAEPGEHGGQRLGQQHVPRAVLVAGRQRALGVVDPADDRHQRERQRDRQIRQRVAQRVQPRQRRPRDREPDHSDGHRRRCGRRRARRAPRRSPRRPARPRRRRARRTASARRPSSASSSTTRATRPTSGSRRILSIGRKAMSKIATPAIEPSSAARGTTRRAQSPANDSATFVEADGDRHGHADLPRAAPGRRWPASPGPAPRRPSRRASGYRCRTASRSRRCARCGA